MDKIKICLIWLLIHTTPFRSCGIKMYGNLLGHIIIDSVNNAEEIAQLGKVNKITEYFTSLMHRMALLPAVIVHEQVGIITGDDKWLKRILIDGKSNKG